jgi:hypothetical protein
LLIKSKLQGWGHPLRRVENMEPGALALSHRENLKHFETSFATREGLKYIFVPTERR